MYRHWLRQGLATTSFMTGPSTFLAARRLRDSELRAEMESELSQVLTFARDEVRRTRQLPRPKHRKDVGWP